MACAAILPCVHIGHLNARCCLHREYFCMAVITLQPFISMCLAIENNLSSAAACVFNGLSRRNCQSASYKSYHNDQGQK